MSKVDDNVWDAKSELCLTAGVGPSTDQEQHNYGSIIEGVRDAEHVKGNPFAKVIFFYFVRMRMIVVIISCS